MLSRSLYNIFHGSRAVRCRSQTYRMACTMSSSATERKVKVFIDCDAGVDDAQGLVLAMSNPEVDVVGISAVHGNVATNQVLSNIARVLKLFPAQQPPYYEGCDEPLLGQPLDASFWHGVDGLGDVPDTSPASDSITVQTAEGHASLGIVKAARQHRGELNLVAIGPLTNVALALKLEPQLPGMLRSLTVMGGSAEAGNATPTAEFNFHCDPEAAHLVLLKFERTTLVTWDAVLRQGLPWHDYDAWLRDNKSAAANFLEHIGRVGVAHDKASPCGGKWLVCDPQAVALAIDDRLITESKDVFCSVELQGQHTRGQLIIDWQGQIKRKANVRLVRSADMEAVKLLLNASVAPAS